MDIAQIKSISANILTADLSRYLGTRDGITTSGAHCVALDAHFARLGCLIAISRFEMSRCRGGHVEVESELVRNAVRCARRSTLSSPQFSYRPPK